MTGWHHMMMSHHSIITSLVCDVITFSSLLTVTSHILHKMPPYFKLGSEAWPHHYLTSPGVITRSKDEWTCCVSLVKAFHHQALHNHFTIVKEVEYIICLGAIWQWIYPLLWIRKTFKDNVLGMHRLQRVYTGDSWRSTCT